MKFFVLALLLFGFMFSCGNNSCDIKGHDFVNADSLNTDVSNTIGDIAQHEITSKDIIMDKVNAQPAVDAIETGEAAQAEVEHNDASSETNVSLYDFSKWKYGNVVKKYGSGFYALVDTQYGELRIGVVKGSHYDMGYQYGHLFGHDLPFMEKRLLNMISTMVEDLGMAGLTGEQAWGALKPLFDKAWKHLSKFMPQQYLDEIDGIVAGAEDDNDINGIMSVRDLLQALIVLTNISDLNEFDYGLDKAMAMLDSGYSSALKDFFDNMPTLFTLNEIWSRIALKPISCSFFAAFGDNTKDGKLYSSRNLDWTTDTGMKDFKLIMFYFPENGTPYFTIGYEGVVGALGGMNANGISIAEVGSGSVLERLEGIPWTIKMREILEKSDSLDSGAKLMTNSADDGQNRPPTIGYNFLIADGDFDNSGANPGAALFETNGNFIGMRKLDKQCKESVILYQYDKDGKIAKTYTHEDNPDLANFEEDAVDIDGQNNRVKLSKDETGKYVLDAENGEYVKVGKTIPCALFRGDEAMIRGIRMWQSAANGAQGGAFKDTVMNSGSYQHRYSVMHDMIEAFNKGIEYKIDDKIIIPDNAGKQVLISDKEAVEIVKNAAMSSNVFSVAYNNTDLKIHIAFEKNSGTDWVKAANNPYFDIDCAWIFNYINNSK